MLRLILNSAAFVIQTFIFAARAIDCPEVPTSWSLAHDGPANDITGAFHARACHAWVPCGDGSKGDESIIPVLIVTTVRQTLAAAASGILKTLASVTALRTIA